MPVFGFPEGTDWHQSVTLLDDAGAIVNLTGATVTAYLYRGPATLFLSPTVTVTSATLGQVLVSVSHAQSFGLAGGYRLEVVAVLASGDQEILYEAEVHITASYIGTGTPIVQATLPLVPTRGAIIVAQSVSGVILWRPVVVGAAGSVVGTLNGIDTVFLTSPTITGTLTAGAITVSGQTRLNGIVGIGGAPIVGQALAVTGTTVLSGNTVIVGNLTLTGNVLSFGSGTFPTALTTSGVLTAGSANIGTDVTIGDRLILTPAYTQITANSQVLNPLSEAILKVDPQANYTMVSTPTIDNTVGVDGQLLILYNYSASHSIIIQDRGTLVGSGIVLTATTLTIGPRGSVQFMYDGNLSLWVQIGPLTQNL